MKKILFIVEAMGGGVFTYIVDLANELAENNEVIVAYGLRPQTPSNYKEYFNDNVKLIKVENFTREINLKKDYRAYREVKRIYKMVNPDIVHLHSSKAGIIGRLAFLKVDVPVFYTPHGYSFLMKNQSKLKLLFYKIIEYVFAKTNAVTIACSKGELKESLKLSKKAKLVNNGINVNELRRQIENINNKRKIDKHSRRVYTLGRISIQKNPELFNKIALMSPDIEFIWIGDGKLRDVLTAPNIKITGWVSRKDALKIALQCDIFILTSLWEGLPMSLLESMYLKKTCVVSDVVGNHDVIENGINGYVCNKAEEFSEVIANTDLKKVVPAAYEDVLREYNTQEMARKYTNIYLNQK